MPLTVNSLNTMLNALTITHLSLHTADPGTTGANEVTGGSYVRPTVTFSTSTTGKRTCTTQPVVPIPACTITHIGFWNASTFLGSYDAVDEVFPSVSTYTVTGAGGQNYAYIELTT